MEVTPFKVYILLEVIKPFLSFNSNRLREYAACIGVNW